MHLSRLSGALICATVVVVCMSLCHGQMIANWQVPSFDMTTSFKRYILNDTFDDIWDEAERETESMKRTPSSTTSSSTATTTAATTSENIPCNNYDSDKCCTKTVDGGSEPSAAIPSKTQSDFPSFTEHKVTINDVAQCKKTAKGSEYRGKISLTRSGRTCQEWDSHSPHNHYHITQSKYPNDGLEKNYCRNPYGNDSPWCYTTDSDKRWEYCAIPNCPLHRTEFKVVGEKVYSSQVSKLITDGGFPPSDQVDKKKEYNLIIKADSFFCDTDVSVKGLTNFTLVARSIQSNNCKINLKHNGLTMKPDGSSGFQPMHGKSATSSSSRNGDDGVDGASGIDGKDGTTAVVAFLSGTGTLKLDTKGLIGLRGGDGGNGGNGYRGTTGSCKISCRLADRKCSNNIKGTSNPSSGGTGGDGGAAGKPGNGGSAGEVKVVVKDTSKIPTKLVITGCKGDKGPKSARAGNPGNGGDGGYAGDKRGCKRVEYLDGVHFSGNSYKVRCDQYKGAPTKCGSDGRKGANGQVKKFSAAVAINDVVECKKTAKGSEYRGKISLTRSGRTCQEWDSHSPHEHYHITQSQYPNDGLEKNYCRNPKRNDSPWCYTTDSDKRWEYCAIPNCPLHRTVAINDVVECKKTAKGSEYRGKISLTRSGRTCQEWDSHSPHEHYHITQSQYPNDGLEKNYCRNPKRNDSPWCYTTDSDKRWEYCAIPYCPLHRTATEGSDLKITLTSARQEIQSYFDETVSELSLQHADEIYMQGKKIEAKKICTSLVGIMESKQQTFIDYCNGMIKQISSGLNYFGYKDNEFLSLDLKTAKGDANRLLDLADSQQEDINNLLRHISTNDVMKSNSLLSSTIMLNSANRQQQEVDQLITLEQGLKRKAIQKLMKMENHMFTLAKKIETDLFNAIEERNRKYAMESRKLALTVVGGFVALFNKDYEAVVEGVNDVLDFAERKIQLSAKGRSCYDKFNEMKAFAKVMMTVRLPKVANPFETKLSDIPSAATAELLKVQTLEKRDDLLLGFKCLIDNSGFSGDTLEGTIGAFFDYSFSRLNIIGMGIQHDIKLKQYQFRKKRVDDTIRDIRAAMGGSQVATYNPALEKARLLFKDRMVDSFRNIERRVLRALYLKSIAFKFITLWDPELLSKVSDMRKPQRTALSDVYFTGHIYLRKVNDYLDNLECKWRKCLAKHTGKPAKSTYLWIFTPQTHKQLFEAIRENGMASFTITKDGICSTVKECVNLRVERVFVEVYGDGLFAKQRVLHSHLTHSGQNLMYMPPDGSTTKYYTQTKEKTVQIGVVERELSQTTCRNGGWRCASAFPSIAKAKDMCTLSAANPFQEMMGTEPCRSLFSQYTIDLPKNELEHESATLNSRFLDWTKITKIKFYAAVRTFRNYPSQADCAGISGCGYKKDTIPKNGTEEEDKNDNDK